MHGNHHLGLLVATNCVLYNYLCCLLLLVVLFKHNTMTFVATLLQLQSVFSFRVLHFLEFRFFLLNTMLHYHEVHETGGIDCNMGARFSPVPILRNMDYQQVVLGSSLTLRHGQAVKLIMRQLGPHAGSTFIGHRPTSVNNNNNNIYACQLMISLGACRASLVFPEQSIWCGNCHTTRHLPS